MNLADSADVFAANRAHGRIDLTVAAADGVTRSVRLREEGSLRMRFPNPPRGGLEGVVVNTAGGAAGGDRFSLRIGVGPGAAMTVTTASAEKVYRSLGPPAKISVALEVATGGRLVWLPQETIVFDRAKLLRSFDVELAQDSSIVLAEAIVFGRSASGEQVEEGSLIDRWRVRREGRLIFAETLRLNGAIAQKLAEPAIAGGGAAIATILISPGDAVQADAVRALADRFGGEVGASCWNGLCLMRFCAQNGARLRDDLTLVLAALRVALPRLWLN